MSEPASKKPRLAPATWKAFSCNKIKGPLTIETITPKKLGEGEILVKVTHCGVCHSDVHRIFNDWGSVGGGVKYPIILGHEVVGDIVETGSNVKDFKTGDRVGLGPQRSCCQDCNLCSKGYENYCEHAQPLYGGKDHEAGGFCEYIRCATELAFHIPSGIKSEHAAPLMCAGATVFEPLRHFGPEEPGKVAVIGIGGLGHLALQFARAMGHEVTAFTTSWSKQEEAKSFGAHHVQVLSEPEKLKDYVRTFDFILNCASAKIDWNTFLEMLKPDGKMCYVGLQQEDIQINPFKLFKNRLTLCSTHLGGSKYIKEMFEVCTKHNIVPKVEIFDVEFNEEGAKSAHHAAEKVDLNTARYRIVLRYPQ